MTPGPEVPPPRLVLMTQSYVRRADVSESLKGPDCTAAGGAESLLAGFRTSGSKATPSGRGPRPSRGQRRGQKGRSGWGRCLWRGRGIMLGRLPWQALFVHPALGFPLSLLPASLSSSGTNGIHYCSSAHRAPVWGSVRPGISTSKKVVTRGDRQEVLSTVRFLPHIMEL